MKRLLLLGPLLGLLFSLVGCDGGAYRQRGAQWRHGDVAFTPEDAATFKPIDDLFARDARRGYYRGAVIAESDGASFAVVSEHEARDRLAVYYCDTYRKAQEYWSIQHLRIARIDGADPASYVSLGRGHARDRSRVYAEGVAIVVRDPASFEPLDGNFSRDAQRGYYAHVEIPGSDGASFMTIDAVDPRYVRDRAHAWFGYPEIDEPTPGRRTRTVRLLRDADLATLRVLGRDYALDARHVWYRGRAVAGADPASFRIDDTYTAAADAHDRSGAWARGERLASVTTVASTASGVTQ